MPFVPKQLCFRTSTHIWVCFYYEPCVYKALRNGIVVRFYNKIWCNNWLTLRRVDLSSSISKSPNGKLV